MDFPDPKSLPRSYITSQLLQHPMKHRQVSITLMLGSLSTPPDCTLEEFLRSDCGLILKRGADNPAAAAAPADIDDNPPLAVKGFTPGVGHLDSRRVRIDDHLAEVNGIPVRLSDALNPAEQYVRRPDGKRMRQQLPNPANQLGRSACLVTLSFERLDDGQPSVGSPQVHPTVVYDLESNCAILVGGGGGAAQQGVPSDTHGLLLLRSNAGSSEASEFADLLFAFPPRRRNRMCELRGFLLALWSAWPDLLAQSATTTAADSGGDDAIATKLSASSAAAAVAVESPCRTVIFEDPDGQEVTAVMLPVGPSVVCALAAPTAWLNGSGADPAQLTSHLLDLFRLLGWPRKPRHKDGGIEKKDDEDDEDSAGENEPMCQLLQVLFTAMSERRLPPSLRRLAWPARRQTASQARDADRLLAAFASGSTATNSNAATSGAAIAWPDFTGHACVLGASLTDSGARVAAFGRLAGQSRLGRACWLFELLHRHFTAYPAGRRRLRVVWLPARPEAFPDSTESSSLTSMSHLRNRPAHLLCVAMGGLSLALLYAGLTNLTGLPQTLLEAAEAFLDCLPAKLPHLFQWAADQQLQQQRQNLQQASIAAVEVALADPADYLTVVNAKSGGGGGGILNWFRSRSGSSKKSKGGGGSKGIGGGSKAGSLGRAASLTSLNDAAGSAGDLTANSQSARPRQRLQQAGGAGVFAYLLLDWQSGVCHASQSGLPPLQSSRLSAPVTAEFFRLVGLQIRPQLLALASGSVSGGVELMTIIEFDVDGSGGGGSGEGPKRLSLAVQGRKTSQWEMYFCLSEPATNLGDMCQELRDLLAR